MTCFEDAEKADMKKFGRWHRGMLERGVYLAPSAYEVPAPARPGTASSAAHSAGGLRGLSELECPRLPFLVLHTLPAGDAENGMALLVRIAC